MTSNRYKYFRWTPRTARITFAYMVVVPAIVGYIAYKTDVSALSVCWMAPSIYLSICTHEKHTYRASTTSALSGEVMTCGSSKDFESEERGV